MKKDESFRIAIRTWYNYMLGENIHDMHISLGDSETVPNQAMTAAEMLRRHASGLNVGGQVPQYSDYDIPDLVRMDLVEIDEYRKQLADEIRHAEEMHKKASIELAKKQDEDRIQKAIEEHEKNKAKTNVESIQHV